MLTGPSQQHASPVCNLNPPWVSGPSWNVEDGGYRITPCSQRVGVVEDLAKAESELVNLIGQRQTLHLTHHDVSGIDIPGQIEVGV